MSENSQKKEVQELNLEQEIKKAQDILKEDVPITQLAQFVETLIQKMSEKYPKMMEMAMSVGTSSAQNTTNNVEQSNEPSSFDVIIKSVGDAQLKVIKEVRAITSLGLAESKKLVDKVKEEGKSILKSGIEKKEAEEIKAKIEAAGATVELVAV